MYTEEELLQLKRAQLQALAKEHGVKANAKSVAIVQELMQIFQVEEASQKEPVVEESDAPQEVPVEEGVVAQVEETAPAPAQDAVAKKSKGRRKMGGRRRKVVKKKGAAQNVETLNEEAFQVLVDMPLLVEGDLDPVAAPAEENSPSQESGSGEEEQEKVQKTRLSLSAGRQHRRLSMLSRRVSSVRSSPEDMLVQSKEGEEQVDEATASKAAQLEQTFENIAAEWDREKRRSSVGGAGVLSRKSLLEFQEIERALECDTTLPACSNTPIASEFGRNPSTITKAPAVEEEERAGSIHDTIQNLVSAFEEVDSPGHACGGGGERDGMGSAGTSKSSPASLEELQKRERAEHEHKERLLQAVRMEMEAKVTENRKQQQAKAKDLSAGRTEAHQKMRAEKVAQQRKEVMQQRTKKVKNQVDRIKRFDKEHERMFSRMKSVVDVHEQKRQALARAQSSGPAVASKSTFSSKKRAEATTPTRSTTPGRVARPSTLETSSQVNRRAQSAPRARPSPGRPQSSIPRIAAIKEAPAAAAPPPNKATVRPPISKPVNWTHVKPRVDSHRTPKDGANKRLARVEKKIFAPAAAASTSSGVNDKENRSDLQAGGTILLTGGKPATSKAGSNLKFVTGGRVSKGVSRKMDYLHRGAESKKAALEQRRQQNPSAPVC